MHTPNKPQPLPIGYHHGSSTNIKCKLVTLAVPQMKLAKTRLEALPAYPAVLVVVVVVVVVVVMVVLTSSSSSSSSSK